MSKQAERLGKELRAVRRDAQKDMRQIADMWGCSISRVSSIEVGEVIPTEQEVLALLELAGHPERAEVFGELRTEAVAAGAVSRIAPVVYAGHACLCNAPAATFCPQHGCFISRRPDPSLMLEIESKWDHETYTGTLKGVSAADLAEFDRRLKLMLACGLNAHYARTFSDLPHAEWDAFTPATIFLDIAAGEGHAPKT